MRGKSLNKKRVIELIEPMMKLGFSVTRACNMVGISQSTVATWLSQDEGLRLKLQVWKHEPELFARRTIIDSLKKGDVKVAIWWLDKYAVSGPLDNDNVFSDTASKHEVVNDNAEFDITKIIGKRDIEIVSTPEEDRRL